MMKTCDEQLGRQFLSGELDSQREEEFAAHLESCVTCRDQLEADAGNETDWQMASDLIHQADVVADNLPEPDAVAADSIHSSNLQSVANSIAPLLAPSDDPSMMGRIGSYEVLGVVGQGGMGIVLKALDPALNRTVAIKTLHPSLATLGTSRERFAREARGMASVSHEHVMPIFGVDQHGDLPYFVMEYVAGGTLETRVQRDGSLTVVSAVRVALQVAEALAAAHVQGLVHRDIKPANILLDRGTERVRVADFGLARISAEANVTRTGHVAGTPQYMSPEQVQGMQCDPRSDLFSLGSLLYGMLAGHAPFRADTVYAAMQRVVHDEPRSLREQNSEVPVWLEQFVERLLQKDPAERFDSAQEAAAVLRDELAYLQNPTEVQQPERIWIRHSRSVTRKRPRPLVLFGGASVFAVVAFVGLASGLLDGFGAVQTSGKQEETAGTEHTKTARNGLNKDGKHDHPSLEQLIQAFARYEKNYLPYHVKAMETFRMNEGLSAHDKRRFPWADGLKHQKQMEYAQRESGLWLRKEIMLKDEAVQARFDQYTNGEQQIKVSERPGSDDGLQVHLERDEYQAKMVACTPYAGVFPLSVYSDSLLLSGAIASNKTTAILEWDGADAILEFHFGWKDKPMRFRLWLSREHGWHPVKLQRFNTASAKQYFSEWQVTNLVQENDEWRIKKGTIGYRHLEDADKDDARVMYFVDFDVISSEFGESVTPDRFVYDIPRHAHIHDPAKPKTPKPIEKTRPMKVTVTGVDGDPVSDARIRFQSKAGQLVESVVTDASGVGTSQAVPAEVLIEVSAPRHRTARWINGSRSNTSRIVLAPVTKGITRNSSGQAIADALVTSQELRFRTDGMAYIPRHSSANRENDWSTESGEFSLTNEMTMFPRDKNVLVMAVDDSVENMAITSVPAPRLKERLELTLLPTCRLEGQFVFETVASKLAFYVNVADDQGRKIAGITPSVRVKDNKTIVTCKLRLPAGSYQLRGRGSTSYPEFSAPLVVPPQKRSLNFGSIPVAATGLSALLGKSAPELKVKTRSGEELLLSELRGDVVVLDFWGHWCIPCVRAMPRLMEVADQFKGRPVRWIAVHDPSLTSFDELDERLSKFENDVWDRKMSLKSVIDVAAQSDYRTGITAGRFGVSEWPTLVIIRQDGTVFGSATKSELAAKLEELIGAPPPAK